jgi:hypothetical protein
MTASRWRRDATLVERRSNTLEARYPGRLHLRYDWREIGSSSVGASGSRLVGDTRTAVARVATGWMLRHLRYPSNSATTISVSLSGSNSPSRASSTIRIATRSATGTALAPVNLNRVQTRLKALCIVSIWSGRKNGALRRPLIASLNLEAPVRRPFNPSVARARRSNNLQKSQDALTA